MNYIFDDESANNLCESIITCIRDNPAEKVDQLLAFLRIICGRPTICLSSLHPEECLIVLIRSRPMREYVKENQDLCSRLIDLFLSCKTLSECSFSCLKVLFDCLPKEGEIGLECSRKMSSHPDFKEMPVDLAEIAFKFNPTHFERQALLVYSKPHERDILRIWAKWSAESSRFFQTISSVLNEVLVIVGKPSLCLGIIDEFIRLTESKCESLGRDFVNHYPHNIQHLVVWMKSQEFEMPIRWPREVIAYVRNEFLLLKNSQPRLALILLTHFNKACNQVL